MEPAKVLPVAVIERAIARTRKNAWTQVVLGMAICTGMVVWPGSSMVLLAILLGVNMLINVVLVRRLWRLRSTGPALAALLHRPEDIASVVSWPPKLSKDRLPLFLDVFTRNNEQCSLLLDAKRRDEFADLVDAIRTRSPEAIITVANEHLGRSVA